MGYDYSRDEYAGLSGYFRLKGDKEPLVTVDDITWNDLNMDALFRIIDNTCTQNGGEYLYDMLRRPLIAPEEEAVLKERGRVSGLFMARPELRDRYSEALGGRERLGKACFRERVAGLNEIREDNDLIHILALILGLVSIAFIFILPPLGFFLFIIASAFNVGTYFKRKNEINTFLPVFRNLILETREIPKLLKYRAPELSEYEKRLENALLRLKSVSRGSFIVMSGKRLTGGLLELPLDFLRIFFHLDLLRLNGMIRAVKREREAVEELFNLTGFLDAMISLSLFKEKLGTFTEPVFREGSSLEIRKGFHPLLKDPVPFDVDNVSLMLLTGSNASGKSTFLKAAAISVLLSETLYTVPAEYYSADRMELLSSMSLRDDLIKGDSLYVTEIKSVQRIVEAQKKGRKTAVFLDEVLKGTNTVERIASLSVLLKHISGNSLVFAATHDTPITYILEDLYDNYHFEEQVTEEGISFPYELKKGRTESRDAIRLLSVMGFDDTITREAFELSEEFLKEGEWKKI
ncbi:MAG: hypothetical protein IJ857_07470 [Lachnospiraceae bacterium]|nr:hypothetical protein [Lachnospiraceae bacterium]